jgi:multidrug efflux pump subunit AcrB
MSNSSKGFNLSGWALEHIPLIRYLIVVLLLGGIFSYAKLGQDEDPPFTFRAMGCSCNVAGCHRFADGRAGDG